MKTVLIADDHPFIRASVRTLMKQERFNVLDEADNGIDALRMARDLEPYLVILDISMPHVDGLEVIQRICAMGLKSKVLVLTSQPPEYFSLRCMKLGAVGYVSKSDNMSELSKAVMAIRSGYTYFPEVAFSSVRRQDGQMSEGECIARLTDRELLILQQLAKGRSNKCIADTMLLSNKTISTYKARLIEKLRVKSVVDLADIAKRHALV